MQSLSGNFLDGDEHPVTGGHKRFLSGRATSDMADEEPRPNNPLSPYYPSDVPSVPGSGRRWFAILFALLLLAGAAFQFLSMFVTL